MARSKRISLSSTRTACLLPAVCLLIWNAALGQTSATPLRSYADQRGFYIAGATSYGELSSAAPAGGQSVAQVVAREFNMMAPEGELEFGSVEPNAPKFVNGQLVPNADPTKDFNFTNAELMVQAAIKNHQVVRGFSLLDYHSAPKWLTNCPPSSPHWPIDCGPLQWTPDELRQIMQYHIQTVITYFKNKYPGAIIAWVVVNEPEYDNTNSNGSTHRVSVFDLIPDATGNAGGYLNYYKLAFQYAHQADPDALLGLNDDHDDDLDGYRVQGLFTVASQLVSAGAPISFVGFEAHKYLPSWQGSYSVPTREMMIQTMKRFADLGLQVMITEADVALPMITEAELSPLLSPAPASAPAYWQDQANIYGTTLSACLLASNCFGYITWGVNPLHSYLNSLSNGLLSYDLTATYSSDGLPFDGNNNPKPAYTAMQTSFANAMQATQIVPAQNMSPISTQTAQLVSNTSSRYYQDYQLLTNGGASASVQLAEEGLYDLHVRAAGLTTGTTYPQLQVSVDGHPTAAFAITSKVTNDYVLSQVNLSAGTHHVEFLCATCTQTSNVFVDRFWEQPAQPFSGYLTGNSFANVSGSTVAATTSAALMTLSPGSSVQRTIAVPASGNYQLTLAAYAATGIAKAPYAQIEVDGKSAGYFKITSPGRAGEYPATVALSAGTHTILVLAPSSSPNNVFLHHVMVTYRADQSIEVRGVDATITPTPLLSASGNPPDMLVSPGGSMQTAISVATAGTYKISLTIAGGQVSLSDGSNTRAQGQLLVDKKLIGSFSATADSWQTTAPFPVALTAGSHALTVVITNQGQETPAQFLNERNLSVQNITITPE